MILERNVTQRNDLRKRLPRSLVATAGHRVTDAPCLPTKRKRYGRKRCCRVVVVLSAGRQLLLLPEVEYTMRPSLLCNGSAYVRSTVLYL
jgi:hypothetical protein